MNIFRRLGIPSMRIFPLFNFRRMLGGQLPSLRDLLGDLGDKQKKPVEFKVKKTQDDVTKKLDAYQKKVEKHLDKMLGIGGTGGKMVKEAKDKLREAGLLIWQAQLDERTCSECASLHGDIFETGGKFEAGPANLHANCRCELVPL